MEVECTSPKDKNNGKPIVIAKAITEKLRKYFNFGIFFLKIIK
jgi:hypothetical protein